MVNKKIEKSIKINFNRFIPLVKSKTDEELKSLVRDLDSGIIYTDIHAQQNNANIMSVFMILMFLKDSGKKTGDTRQDKIYNILLESQRTEYFKSIGKTEDEVYDEYVKSIGMIYEYMDKASPMGINGQPCFMSCQFLSKEDANRMWVFYGKYQEYKDLLKEF